MPLLGRAADIKAVEPEWIGDFLLEELVDRYAGNPPAGVIDTVARSATSRGAAHRSLMRYGLPAVAAPLCTYTGWNPRRQVDGLPDVLYERVGSRLPFPPGRPSATERYPTRDDYAAAVRLAAEKLVADRFLLPEDVDAIIDKAVADY